MPEVLEFLRNNSTSGVMTLVPGARRWVTGRCRARGRRGGRPRYAGWVRRFLTRTWLVRHVVLVLAVAVCAALAVWQFDRALAGNMLSYAYAVEWPVFGLFAILLWVREIRLTLHADRPAPAREDTPPVDEWLTTVPEPSRGPGEGASDESGLGAYNEYLAWLAADPSRRPADYRR